MPTLLRLLIAVPPLVLALVGAVVLAAADAPDAALAGGALALALLITPPLLAGVVVSYHAWTGEARRRLRAAVAVAASVQLLALAGWIVVLVVVPPARPGGVAIGLLALAAGPGAVVLGRAARRREPPLEGRGSRADLLGKVRTARRRRGVGAAIGCGVGVVVLAVGVVLDGGGTILPWAAVVPLLTCVGANLGSATSTLAIGRAARALLGDDWSSSRRIGRALAGRPEHLSDDEADRAARYACVAPAWLRLQATTQVLNALLPLALLGATLDVGGGDDPSWFIVGVLAVAAAGAIAAAVLLLVQSRRVRRYAAAHPAPAD